MSYHSFSNRCVKHTFPWLSMMACGSLKGVCMICVMVTGLGVKGHRHTRGNRGRSIPMGQLPGTVVILQAFNLPDQAKASSE